MIAARTMPSENNWARESRAPQGGQIGRVQVGLPGQRLPHDSKRRQPGENTKRPQRLGLQPDRSLDPGGLHLLNERDVDPAQARGPHLAQERLAAQGAPVQPDQQRRIARRWPDVVRIDEGGHHVDAAEGRGGADRRELPRGGHDALDVNGSWAWGCRPARLIREWSSARRAAANGPMVG